MTVDQDRGRAEKICVSPCTQSLSLSLSGRNLHCCSVCELGVCGCAWASVCGAEIWRKQPFWRHGDSS